MEEGLEPHEVIERTVEHHHHEEGHRHESAEKRFLMLAAVAAAVLAVLAALGSLLSGHAANQAILSQTQAADKWAYFQAKSTKGHLYEVSKEVVASLGASVGSVVRRGRRLKRSGAFRNRRISTIARKGPFRRRRNIWNRRVGTSFTSINSSRSESLHFKSASFWLPSR